MRAIAPAPVPAIKAAKPCKAVEHPCLRPLFAFSGLLDPACVSVLSVSLLHVMFVWGSPSIASLSYVLSIYIVPFRLFCHTDMSRPFCSPLLCTLRRLT